MTVRACTREEVEATAAGRKADKTRAALAELVASTPALIDIAYGRAPVALGVIRRAVDALAVLRHGK